VQYARTQTNPKIYGRTVTESFTKCPRRPLVWGVELAGPRRPDGRTLGCMRRRLLSLLFCVTRAADVCPREERTCGETENARAGRGQHSARVENRRNVFLLLRRGPTVSVTPVASVLNTDTHGQHHSRALPRARQHATSSLPNPCAGRRFPQNGFQ